MPRRTALLLALATLSATALAQAAYPAGQSNINGSYSQSQTAPIQRTGPANDPNYANQQQPYAENDQSPSTTDQSYDDSDQDYAPPAQVQYAAPYPAYAYGYPYAA